MTDPALTADDLGQDFDPLVTDDPVALHQDYRRMRGQCPVAHTDAYAGYWALTRYDDVLAAATDSETFISSVRAVVPSDPRGLRRPPLNFDAPRHTPYRRALDRTLQRGRLLRLEPSLRRHAAEQLAPLLERGFGDISQEYGARFPAWVTTEWLNLSDETAPLLAETAARWVNAWRTLDRDVVNEMSGLMYDIARELVAERRRNPLDATEDPASSLLQERVDGQPLEEEHLVGALRQCLVVGMVAPPILLGSVCAHLSRDQDLQTQLRTRPELMEAAVEEFLRLYTPYRGFARTASRDVTLHGRTIRPNEPVTLVYASANRDESQFDDPDTFRLGRENITQHLGFGRGRHRCAGMPLARLGVRIALEELLARTERFEINGEPEFARMPEIGLVSLPLTLVPRTSSPS